VASAGWGGGSCPRYPTWMEGPIHLSPRAGSTRPARIIPRPLFPAAFGPMIPTRSPRNTQEEGAETRPFLIPMQPYGPSTWQSSPNSSWKIWPAVALACWWNFAPTSSPPKLTSRRLEEHHPANLPCLLSLFRGSLLVSRPLSRGFWASFQKSFLDGSRPVQLDGSLHQLEEVLV
jgi:hypothetical protein